MDQQRNGYTFSKQWFEFAYQNPDKITPTHAALYFWLIQLNNNLDWKIKFGVPTVHTMEVLGIKSFKTYKKAFDDLQKWDFIQLVAKSTNQYTANVIALVKFTEACPKHIPEQGDIDKPLKTKKPIKTKEPENPSHFIDSVIDEFKKVFTEYVITTPGKESASAAKLLAVFKEMHSELNSAEMIEKFREYFEDCRNIKDKFYKNNMSMSLMVSKFNEINNVLKNPRQQGTSPDLATVDTSNFLNDGQ